MAKNFRNLIIKLLFLLPIVVVVITVNYTIDPSHIFTGGAYEKGIAKLLLKGENVAKVGNYDDRLLQKLYIKGLKDDKDVVVDQAVLCILGPTFSQECPSLITAFRKRH